MVILSVDYGRVRTGIAVCDKNEIIASPVTVIKEVRQEVLAEKIAVICNEKYGRKRGGQRPQRKGFCCYTA